MTATLCRWRLLATIVHETVCAAGVAAVLQDFKVLYPMLTDYDIRYYIFLLLRALDYSHSQVGAAVADLGYFGPLAPALASWHFACWGVWAFGFLATQKSCPSL